MFVHGWYCATVADEAEPVCSFPHAPRALRRRSRPAWCGAPAEMSSPATIDFTPGALTSASRCRSGSQVGKRSVGANTSCRHRAPSHPTTHGLRSMRWLTARVRSSGVVAVVLDANVWVVALLQGGGTAQSVRRACLRSQYQPALLAEYEGVPNGTELFAESVRAAKE